MKVYAPFSRSLEHLCVHRCLLYVQRLDYTSFTRKRPIHVLTNLIRIIPKNISPYELVVTV